MMLLDNEHLLFIEPKGPKTGPIEDEITFRMEYLFSQAKEYGPRWKGFHTCSCGAMSKNHNYILPNGLITNSLCIHYIRDHRGEVPQSEIDKIMGTYEYGGETILDELRHEVEVYK